jgi:tRNA threonylcarbamoyladenosine biosynthesis protein TsaB
MLILAFDTCMAAVSVVVWRDGAVLAAARVVMAQGQAEALMPLIEKTMTQAGVGYDQLDRIAVTVGPGSFTGVRVGLAAARGVGLAAGKPVIGVTTTEVLAAQVNKARVLVTIDTKRGDFYAQRFEDGKAIDEIAVISADTLAGEDPAQMLVLRDGDGLLPDVAVLARLAATRAPEPGGPLPVYARAPDAVIPQHGGRLRP